MGSTATLTQAEMKQFPPKTRALVPWLCAARVAEHRQYPATHKRSTLRMRRFLGTNRRSINNSTGAQVPRRAYPYPYRMQASGRSITGKLLAGRRARGPILMPRRRSGGGIRIVYMYLIISR